MDLVIYDQDDQKINERSAKTPLYSVAVPFNFNGYNTLELNKVVNGLDEEWVVTVNGYKVPSAALRTDRIKAIIDTYAEGRAYLNIWDHHNGEAGLNLRSINDQPFAQANRFPILTNPLGCVFVEKGKTISLKLTDLFVDPENTKLTYTADKGTVGEEDIWTYEAATDADELITVTATDADGKTAEYVFYVETDEDCPIWELLSDEIVDDPSSEPGETDKPNPPKMGDTTPLTLFIVIFGISGAALIGGFAKDQISRRRKEQN